VLGVELRWGVVAEGALLAEDLLERRTRLSLVEVWHEAGARGGRGSPGGAARV
jgi:glycerol-3-phosphate dehydrogenase